MLGRGTTIFPDNLALGTAGEEAFAFKPGADRGRASCAGSAST